LWKLQRPKGYSVQRALATPLMAILNSSLITRALFAANPDSNVPSCYPAPGITIAK
jgi:hypothetical protein